MGFFNYFCPGDVEFANQKTFPGGGGSGLKLTDTLLTCLKAEIFSESCIIHAQEETFSCCAATTVWAVLMNHRTKTNNDQNDSSRMPKMT